MLVLNWIGLPLVLIVTAAVFVQDKIYILQVPKPFERALRQYIPLHLLYPNAFDKQGVKLPLNGRKRLPSFDQDDTNDNNGNNKSSHATGSTVGNTNKSTSTSNTSSTTAATVTATIGVKKDFSGVWKRVKTTNFEALLEAQGAGYVQRKVAVAAPLTHIITMDENLTVFRLQEKSGVLDTDNEYLLSKTAAPIETVFSGGKKFLDSVEWGEVVVDGVTYSPVIHIKKIQLPERNYELNVYRLLEDDGKTLKTIARYQSLKQPTSSSSKQPTTVEAISVFTKTGPSPNERPQSDMSDEVVVSIPTTTYIDDAEVVPVYSKPPVSQDIYKDGGGDNDNTIDAMDTSSYSNSIPSTQTTQSRSRVPSKARSLSTQKSIPRDLSGVWTRTKTVNFEAFIGLLFIVIIWLYYGYIMVVLWVIMLVCIVGVYCWCVCSLRLC